MDEKTDVAITIFTCDGFRVIIYVYERGDCDNMSNDFLDKIVSSTQIVDGASKNPKLSEWIADENKHVENFIRGIYLLAYNQGLIDGKIEMFNLIENKLGIKISFAKED